MRTGDTDLPDAQTARAVGSTVADLLETVPSGTEVVIAYFGRPAAPAVTVVGPAGFSAALDRAPTEQRVCDVRRQHFGEQELVEIVPLQAS